ncbi:alpha-(1,6)-fucosyltransferase-like [Penaeus japonicus]|uniref:alpha-(1,6)-fucosyltransferase-like n=1 Tax=Penaeus japonicus TaxID=27405 RepID=UPI001C70D8F6|nr:alpha-(1,6)-fucosyltransferase-like [Penaeus japonicus]
MQTLRPDAPARVFSVDTPYYFHLESQQVVEARYPHSPRRREELELQKGDRVAEIPMYFRKTPNQHDGFLRGKNLRTGRIGFYPVYKTVNVLRIADTPSFDAIDNSEV